MRGDIQPNTATKAKDYADALIARIKNGGFGDQTKFIIYIQSNQPYTERQTLTIQKELNRAVKDNDVENLEISAEGVGFGIKTPDIKRIHSELGALMSIKYQVALDKDNLQSTRQLGDLQFSTRDKSVITTEIPDYSHITTSGPLDSQLPFLGDIKYFFFEYFEEM